MKNLTFILLFFIIISTSINTHAQGLAIGIGGGLASVQSPDHFTKSVGDGGFGMGNEYYVGMKLKIGIPLPELKPIISLYYIDLNGDGTSEGSSIKYSTSLLTLGVGVEWIVLTGPISGFLALDFFIASFGKLKKITDGNLEVLDNVGFSRNGIGFGFGADYNISTNVSLDATIKFHLNNLIGEYEISDEIWFGGDEGYMNTINITVNIFYNI